MQTRIEGRLFRLRIATTLTALMTGLLISVGSPAQAATTNDLQVVRNEANGVLISGQVGASCETDPTFLYWDLQFANTADEWRVPYINIYDGNGKLVNEIFEPLYPQDQWRAFAENYSLYGPVWTVVISVSAPDGGGSVEAFRHTFDCSAPPPVAEICVLEAGPGFAKVQYGILTRSYYFDPKYDLPTVCVTPAQAEAWKKKIGLK